MSLSAPIFKLKSDAKKLVRKQQIPLHAALDLIAKGEGFKAWSHLAARYAQNLPVMMIYDALKDGEINLLGGRPGHGKTLLAMNILVEAMRAGHHATFFSFEYVEQEIEERFAAIHSDLRAYANKFTCNLSDDIDSDLISSEVRNASAGDFVAVDYLQILDQKRSSPTLSDQVKTLKKLARDQKLKIFLTSQIDRKFANSDRPMPGPEDIRLPNPLDLGLFDKLMFIHDGKCAIQRR